MRDDNRASRWCHTYASAAVVVMYAIAAAARHPAFMPIHAERQRLHAMPRPQALQVKQRAARFRRA